MKKKTVEEPVYETVKKKKGTKKVEYYVANDGKKFSDEAACLKYEEDLEKGRIFSLIPKFTTSTDLDFNLDYCLWYLPKTQEELEIYLEANNYYHYTLSGKKQINSYAHIYGALIPGKWVTCYHEDGGDYHDTWSFYTFDFIKHQFESFLAEFENQNG